MEEKLICCCGASGWTRVIAWLEIIGAGFLMLGLTFLLVFTASYTAANLNDKTLSPEEIQSMELKSTVVMAFSTVLLILTLLAFVMAFILLRGSHTGNPRDIQAWMVYTSICLIITTVLCFIVCFVAPSLASDVLIDLAFEILIQGFFLWVVGTHKKEIEAAHTPVYPVKV